MAAGRAAADLYRRRQAAAHRLRRRRRPQPRSASASRSSTPTSCMPGSRGFLAAVLRPGLRAVSVPATATTRGVGLHLCRRSGRRAADPRAERPTRAASTPRPRRSCATPASSPWTRGSTSRRATSPRSARPPRSSSPPSRPRSSPWAVKMGDLSLVLRSLQDEEEARRRGHRRRRHGRARPELHPRRPGQPADQGTGAAQAAGSRQARDLRPARRRPHQARTGRQHLTRWAAAAGRDREAQHQQGHHLHPH